MRNPGPPMRTKPLARAALALYPPSWRARYGDEVHALLEQTGGGSGAAASLAWRALPAWIWPPAHLHDRPARMRSSLATGNPVDRDQLAVCEQLRRLHLTVWYSLYAECLPELAPRAAELLAWASGFRHLNHLAPSHVLH